MKHEKKVLAMADRDNRKTMQQIKQSTLFTWFSGMHRELPGFFKLFLIFGLVSNILMLVSPLYMLQIYDRVLTSGSTDTLIWLSIIAVFLFGIYAAAEMAKRRVSSLAAEEIEEKISERIFRQFDSETSAANKLPQQLMTLGRLRGLFQNQMILPFFDIPFAPLFLGIMFIIHPIIGFVGLIGGGLLLFLAIMAERKTRDISQRASATSSHAFELASGLGRQRSAMVAMGLAQNALTKWRLTKLAARELNLDAGAQEGAFSSASRSGRQILQIMILGTGAALAISQEISPGAIVAGSIIMSRALAPIDQIVGSWRAITQSRNAWEELDETLDKSEPEEFTPLPKPDAKLNIDRLSVSVPGLSKPLIYPFSVQFTGGQFIALMGANGSGKTSMLQTIASAWPAASGSVALGGRNVHDWPNQDCGQYVGYVPQGIELIPGTVAENIARMGQAESEDIIAAAKKVNAHDMILGLAKGYETEVGTGASLSAGQRQLIGLARAVFGNPVLLLLDEPTANLDPEASRTMLSTIHQLRKEGAIIIAATHDQNMVANSTHIMAIRGGAVSIADTKEYIKSLKKPSKLPSNGEVK